MAHGSTRRGAPARRSGGKQTGSRKKSGSVNTDVRPSKPVVRSRTTARAASGKTEKVVKLRDRATPIKGEGGVVSVPFYSDAMRAHVLEYQEPDAKMPGGTWESRIYCSLAEQAMTLYGQLRLVTTRKEWLTIGHLAAKEIAAGRGEWFLYRVTMGERADRLR